MIFSLQLNSKKATRIVARFVAQGLSAGDCLLLSGDIGVGKSYFAREIITFLLQQDQRIEDIPSPTFTLVQTYQTQKCEIWHADLYRLHTIDELDELGLFEAFEYAICLVEWPALLDTWKPYSALNCILIRISQNKRKLLLDWQDTKWDTLILTLNKKLKDNN